MEIVEEEQGKEQIKDKKKKKKQMNKALGSIDILFYRGGFGLYIAFRRYDGDSKNRLRETDFLKHVITFVLKDEGRNPRRRGVVSCKCLTLRLSHK